jgi:O-antigen/teichoic acid export membrane protein
MSVAVAGIVAFLFRGLNLIVAFATLTVTSNQLGTEGRGTVALGLTVIGIVSATTGGLTAAAAYQVSNQKRPQVTVLANGGVIALALGALAIIAGFTGARVLSGEASALSVAVGASSAAVIVNSVLAGVFLGNGSLIRYNLALVLPPLLSLVAICIGFFVFGHRSPEDTLAEFAIGQWLATPLLVASGAVLGDLRAPAFDRMLVRALVRFSLLAGVSSGVSFLNYRADQFVVGHFEGTGGVGVYSGAVLIAEAVWQFSGSLSLATYARIGGLEQGEAALLTARVMRHTIVMLLAVCGTLFALADVIVSVVFKPEFAPMAAALRILLPGTLLYGLASAFSGYYTYQRGRPWAAAIVAGAGLAIDIGLALILVPIMGVNGAALASSIAYSLAILGGIAVFLRSTGLGPAAVFRFGRDDLNDYVALSRRMRGLLATRLGRPG